ncbi:LytR family transcriptional regulator, partial [Streptomyces sp. SID1046]|nr:LytR family transcriptional regulator [Streptomyces sp. SID1046]
TVAAALPCARVQADPTLDAVVEVTVGARPVQVEAVTFDRNVADGAPVTADRLRCAEAPAAAGAARPGSAVEPSGRR